MVKRVFDFLLSFLVIVLLSPLILIFSFLVFFQDFKAPFYISKRVGRDGEEFNFIKFRSMKVNADLSGIDSTSENDIRITFTGTLMRKYKIDEIPQLVHVILGKMSLVGPRPNVRRDVNIYTEEEKLLLTVRPGITDFSSIVFSDEGKILSGSENPDIKYNQVIRPWKSRLGLFYIEKSGLFLDTALLLITFIAIINKKYALFLISKLLSRLNAKEDLIEVCKRNKPLIPHPPPGSNEVVLER